MIKLIYILETVSFFVFFITQHDELVIDSVKFNLQCAGSSQYVHIRK